MIAMCRREEGKNGLEGERERRWEREFEEFESSRVFSMADPTVGPTLTGSRPDSKTESSTSTPAPVTVLEYYQEYTIKYTGGVPSPLYQPSPSNPVQLAPQTSRRQPTPPIRAR